MVSKKLQELINREEVSAEDFALKIGVGKSSIYKILRGDTKKITNSLAEKINNAFPNYSIEDLLSYNLDTKLENQKPELFLIKEGIKVDTKEVSLFVVNNHIEMISSEPLFNEWVKNLKKDAIIEFLESKQKK